MQEPRPAGLYDVLHIGRSKCASTYLQRAGLLAHPQVELVFAEHKTRFHRYWDYGFGDSAERFVADLRAIPIERPKAHRRVRVFSHESLSGNMTTGLGARLIADLSVAAFGPIRAFVIVREPYGYIYSVWNQYIQEGGVLSFEQFLFDEASPSWNRDRRLSRLWETALNVPLIDYWTEQVGVGNLGVFLFEDLIKEPAAFWRSVYGFLGVDSGFEPPPSAERSAYPYSMAGLKRRLNRLVRTQHNPAGWLPMRLHPAFRQWTKRLAPRFPNTRKPSARAFAPPEVRDWIRVDNDALGERLGRDLSTIGYRG